MCQAVSLLTILSQGYFTFKGIVLLVRLSLAVLDLKLCDMVSVGKIKPL